MLELACGDSSVLLCPETGGAIARFTWRGRDILRPVGADDLDSGNARRLGMFPLAPYSNRIGDGVLALGGERRQLRLNCPGEPHSMHGFAWQRAWTVVRSDSAGVQLCLEHPGDADWPFRCRVEQRLALRDDTLYVDLGLVNLDARPMPAGLGFHPYFAGGPATRLQLDWDGRWEMDARKLPSHWQALAGADDFSLARPLGDWHSDHCYTGWERTATLDYGTHLTTVTADAGCSRLVCFVPDDGRRFIALEPVSHVNNGFALAQRGVEGTGARLLQPGARMNLEMAIAVRAAP